MVREFGKKGEGSSAEVSRTEKIRQKEKEEKPFRKNSRKKKDKGRK